MIVDDPTPDTAPDTEPAPAMGVRVALDHVVSRLGPDEQRVLTRIAQRLVHGAAVYGRLDLGRDLRDFRSREAREEVEDALVYLACAWLTSQAAVTA